MIPIGGGGELILQCSDRLWPAAKQSLSAWATSIQYKTRLRRLRRRQCRPRALHDRPTSSPASDWWRTALTDWAKLYRRLFRCSQSLGYYSESCCCCCCWTDAGSGLHTIVVYHSERVAVASHVRNACPR